MSADPNENRGMKAIVQETLIENSTFRRTLSEARRKMGIKP